MEKRYQVFVSSTYNDLIDERNEVMQALLELECMPAGMELFPAANDTQWNWIKKVIDESDYYIVIVAGRYGSVSKQTGQSYTEMEYRYALETEKPVIGFLYEDPMKLPAESTEQSPQIRKKLEAFRALVKSKLCKFYSSPADLGAKVSRSITQLKKQYPAVRWVRADALDHLASSDEILRLMKENEVLKEKLFEFGIAKPKEFDLLASGDELVEIDFSFSRRAKNPEGKFYKWVGKTTATVEISWNEIFSDLAPDILEFQGKLHWHPTECLNGIIEVRAEPLLKKKYPSEKSSGFRILPKSYDTIMTQFRALKLISINREGNWELTPYGDSLLVQLIAVHKGERRPN